MKSKVSHGQECSTCRYTWFSRVDKPKSCPRCKGRLDRLPKKNKNAEKAKVEAHDTSKKEK